MGRVPNPSTFVAIGDGISMDTVGTFPSQADNGQFSMEVNNTGSSGTPPSLRHDRGACIGFVDGHAEKVILALLTPAIPLSNAPNTPIDRWQSEYLNGGAQFNPASGSTSLPSGVVRNPAMPLVWSDIEVSLYPLIPMGLCGEVAVTLRTSLAAGWHLSEPSSSGCFICWGLLDEYGCCGGGCLGCGHWWRRWRVGVSCGESRRRLMCRCRRGG